MSEDKLNVIKLEVLKLLKGLTYSEVRSLLDKVRYTSEEIATI